MCRHDDNEQSIMQQQTNQTTVDSQVKFLPQFIK